MPVYNRTNLDTLIKEITTGSILPVYLLIGDRFLCQQAADSLGKALCGDSGTVHTIDGDSEDINATAVKLRSYSLLPGRQVFRVNSSRLFHSKKVAKSLWNRAVKAMAEDKPEQAANCLRAMMEAGGLDSSDPGNDLAALTANRWKQCFAFARPGQSLEWTGRLLAETGVNTPPTQASSPGDPAELLQGVLEAGVPTGNILLLLADEVDKRKKLYKFFKKHYAIIDLSVDSGAGAQAQKAQQAVLRELVSQTLQAMGKTMPPAVAGQLFERVGFHPKAVVMETEKLALFVGDADRITLEDLNAVVGRTRQEALFELTQAVGKKNLDSALLILTRLQANGIHGLAIIATLRNFTRKMLLFCSLLHQPQYGVQPNMAANVFQQRCLPLLKVNERWKKELSGHPYAVYMQFTTAAGFSLAALSRWLRLILAAERRLKGSPVDADTVLHHLMLSMLSAADKGTLQNKQRALHY